jgi:hypothetical protein
MTETLAHRQRERAIGILPTQRAAALCALDAGRRRANRSRSGRRRGVRGAPDLARSVTSIAPDPERGLAFRLAALAPDGCARTARRSQCALAEGALEPVRKVETEPFLRITFLRITGVQACAPSGDVRQTSVS